MSETATEDMHTETPAVEGTPNESVEAPVETAETPSEESEKNASAPVDPNAGYEKGKYSWNGDGEKSIKAAGDVLGAKISDYAWGDGEKKATVYITLDGLDDLPDDAIDLKLVDPREVSLIVAFPSIKRMLELKRTYGEIDSVKMIRKKGKNQVVIKLVKKKASPWYSLLSAAGSNDYDLSDDDDYEEPADNDYEEPADNDIELGGDDDGGADAEMTDSAPADLGNEGDMADDSFEEDGADVTSASTD